jgi:hypothetical protein
MQEKAIYTMDKLIRERLKKGSFGYNNSKLLNLQQDLKENSDFLNNSSSLMQKLKEESNARPSGMTYSDWLRQKTAAERIKNKLKVKIKRAETENMLKQEQIDEEVFLENQVAVQRWMKKKQKEAFRAKKEKKKEKSEKNREKNVKNAQGEEAYRNWLREKIREECTEYEKKKKETKEEKKKIAQDKLREAEFKLRCEQAYQEWLEKVKAGRNCISRKSSIGRKKLGSEQESYYLSI